VSSKETDEGPSERDPLEDLKQDPGPGETGLSRRQKRLIQRLLREDEAEKEGLFEGIWSREEAREVHDHLDERGREREAKQLSREWEEAAPENLALRGEEGKIRPALSRGEETGAAEAFQKADDARREEIWTRLRDGEKRRVLHGIAERRRRSVGTQTAYEALSEEEQTVAVHAQMSGMTGREDDRIAEELVEVAEGRESISEKTSAIEDALPSQSSLEALRSAFEKAERIMESQSRGGGEDEQSRGWGGRDR
jgi:hypothetical protein